MQAMGRLGSYISKGVYTVSGPFHPFGGAVDIIVVQQPDGSYKSSPWYVRFGKFQGVLKTREKVVNIRVNGVEADFHMYLDHKGEAFFLKEVDVDERATSCSPPYSSGEDTERQPRKSRSCNYDYKPNWDESSEFEINKKAVVRSNSRRARFLGAVFGRRSSRKDDGIIHKEENINGVVRTESLERAEMAADLLDLQWSTNLLLSRQRKEDALHFPPCDTSKDEGNKHSKVGVCNSDGMDLSSDPIHLDIENDGGENIAEASLIGIVRENEKTTDSEADGLSVIHEEKISASEFSHGASENIIAESYSRSISVHPLNASSEIVESESVVSISSSVISTCIPAETETQTVLVVESLCDSRISRSDAIDSYIKASSITEEERLLFGDLDDPCSIDTKQFGLTKEAESSFPSGAVDEANVFTNAKCCASLSLDQSVINDYMDTANLQKSRLRNVSSDGCIINADHVQSKELTRMARSLPTSLSCNDLRMSNLSHSSDSSCSDTKAGACNIRPPCNNSLRGSQRSWPFSFRKSKGVKVSHCDMNVTTHPNTTEYLQRIGDLDEAKDLIKVKTNKKKVKRLMPTSEQLASLNLKEGKNTVVFTFSTSMLGKQQVDARIFLWRWDTRIVISDVDGTITRSDLLGQVMPLVGMDWSQTGVAHLFSAIKENGYELLFLSARSISQSFITRQFLFNIKQDGKALPEGPVVISPDGLFPSLFREVVRRAPHEFKIACLEDIKALFPADTNPFYAGFGNRDTDEFSYLKVGIPKGKIFIINPKGDIVVNRRVNKKSYSSLHTLVHGMFPSMSSTEQEDFNTWNYWKLPPPVLDI